MPQILQLFDNYIFLVVAAGAAVLGALSGMVGTFVVLRKQSLLGDAVSHSALPGIALAYMLTGLKETEVLLAGAILAGLCATYFIGRVVKHSKLTYDTALALIMSVFFGVGMILLSIMQKQPGSNQAGISNFIFGNAASLLTRDVYFLLGLFVFVLLIVLVFWKELKLFTFDPEFARSGGINGGFFGGLISFLTVLTIIAGLQTVGVILMSAMLIAPAVAARQWTDKLSVMTVLSATNGAVAGVIGTVMSSSMDKMPTGPAIVLAVSAIAAISLLFAPKRGIVWRRLRRKNTGGNAAEKV